MTLHRRQLLLAAPALLLGCDRLGRAPAFHHMVLRSGEWLAYRAQRLLGSEALAREYPPEAASPRFRTNGNTRPRDADWQRHAGTGFADWRLEVSGAVTEPLSLSLADLRAMPARAQVTRHDCVEGWSAIGAWRGTPLKAVLARAGLSPRARYIAFHCADDFSGTPYYESIDLVDAFHPQTILAWEMNGQPLPEGHGAPLRLRVERQLGYKQAKFITRIEAVDSLAPLGRGRGGFWEDVGDYAWYAGI